MGPFEREHGHKCPIVPWINNNQFKKQIIDRKTIRMDDQQTCEFWFKITPTQIQAPNSKPNNEKSFLIKLGNKQGKFKSIGSSIEMNVEVLYSKSSRKFFPIKFIMRAFEVSPNGTEMILFLAVFDTQELLSEKGKVVHLEKQSGSCKIFLTIETRNLTFEKKQQKTQAKPLQISRTDDPNMQLNIRKASNSSNSKQQLYNIEKKFIKSPRFSESDCQQSPSPYIMDDSSDFIDENSKSRCSEASDEIRYSEKEAIGQELVQERRKNRLLEDKLEKSNIKIQLLRKSLAQKNNQMKTYYQNFKNFSAGLESDSRGQYIFEMNERKREVSLRYKANIKFKQVFEEFIAFMIRKMTEGSTLVGSEKTIEDEAEVNRILSKIENFDIEKKKSYEQNYKMVSEINGLRREIGEKNIEISTKDGIIKKKMEEIKGLEQKIAKAMDQKSGLEGLNQYLQERDTQMETIIDSLKKMITDKNSQVDALAQKNRRMSKQYKNLQLYVDEMKQQNANLLQTIEGYRQNYGELKTAKDKALQREFKECIRWIDQQNHDEDLILEDTTEQNSETRTVTSIIKSFGEIENMPLEEICSIRKEVINVLKRLDQFVARNSLN